MGKPERNANSSTTPRHRAPARQRSPQRSTSRTRRRTRTTDSKPNRAAINRANAQHSTGPKTVDGKSASSQNSFKHGLYSKQLVMQGENPAELDALKADLRAEHQPANTTEEILVNEIAEHYWRIRRFRRMEAIYLSVDFDTPASA